MRIAVCDDEQAQCALLSGYLKEWAKERRIASEISCFYSAESFLFSWEEETFDLLLLDIEMGSLSGMELAKKIRLQDEDIPVLFITGYDRYMAQGYEVSALHYLLKPVCREKLCEVLDGLMRKKKPEEKLVFPTSEGRLLLAASQIWYVEAMGHDCVLRTEKDRGEIRMSMGEALGILGGRREFVQCHRSYLINLQHISAIVKGEIVLDDGERIPVSRRMYREVNEAFIRLYR